MVSLRMNSKEKIIFEFERKNEEMLFLFLHVGPFSKLNFIFWPAQEKFQGVEDLKGCLRTIILITTMFENSPIRS